MNLVDCGNTEVYDSDAVYQNQLFLDRKSQIVILKSQYLASSLRALDN